PVWRADALQFPSTAGQQFVTSLGASGGTSAVDAAFRKPPASTEQILHFDKYLSHEVPVKVSAPSLARALGSGWRAEPADTLAEALIRFWLRALGVTDADVQEAAGGWGGDRLVAA